MSLLCCRLFFFLELCFLLLNQPPSKTKAPAELHNCSRPSSSGDHTPSSPPYRPILLQGSAPSPEPGEEVGLPQPEAGRAGALFSIIRSR